VAERVAAGSVIPVGRGQYGQFSPPVLQGLWMRGLQPLRAAGAPAWRP
jgi:hypothetical protein